MNQCDIINVHKMAPQTEFNGLDKQMGKKIHIYELTRASEHKSNLILKLS